MKFDEQAVREGMCDIGRRVWERGMVAANDGNFSVKISSEEILCTPTGVSKGFMSPDMICKVDLEGRVLQSDGIHKPSSEIKMHLRIYQRRPDVNAVVHAHPMYATVYAVLGRPLAKQLMPEATLSFGEVPIARYGLPSSTEVPDSLEPFLATYDVVLLQNHGALAVGVDLLTAYYRMETLELFAKISLVAHQLGGAKEIPKEQINKLLELRKNYYQVSGRHPGYKKYPTRKED